MEQAYSEVLQIIQGHLVAKEMEESILKHAAMSVAIPNQLVLLLYGCCMWCVKGQPREDCALRHVVFYSSCTT